MAIEQGLRGVAYSPEGVDEALVRTQDLAARLGLPDLPAHLTLLGVWLKASL